MSDALTLTATQATALRKTALSLATKRFRADWELMKVLWQTRFSKVEDRPVCFGWGFSSWQDWVEAEVGISASKAGRLARTYYVFGVECEGLWESKYKDLPYEKLVELITIVNRKNCLRWLKFASEHTVMEIRDRVWEMEEGEGQAPRHHRFHAGFNKKEINVVEKGIAAARDHLDSNFRGELLAYIVEDWLKAKKKRR